MIDHTEPTPTHGAPESASRRLTLADGGYVLVIMAVLSIALLVWGLAPAVLNLGRPRLGDGQDPASYGFDLSSARIDVGSIHCAQPYRDLIAPMDDPQVIAAVDLPEIDANRRGKIIVPTDRVAGVSINGEARAYPLWILNCHEVVNDELGGVPIAVTYSPPSDSVVVLDRRIGDRVVEFGVSGLVHQGHGLLYDRREGDAEPGGESLWSPLRRRAVTGPAAAANARLAAIPVGVIGWAQWLADHPETSVIDRDPMIAGRYKEVSYERYFASADIMFPVEPMPSPATEGSAVPDPKDRVIVVDTGFEQRVYPVDLLREAAGELGVVRDVVGDWQIVIVATTSPRAAYVVGIGAVREGAVRLGRPPAIFQTMWYAWYAIDPGAAAGALVTDATGLRPVPIESP